MPIKKAVKSSKSVVKTSRTVQADIPELAYVIGVERRDLRVMRVRRNGKFGPKDSYVGVHKENIVRLLAPLAIHDILVDIWGALDNDPKETMQHEPAEMATLHLSMFTPPPN